MANYRMPDGKVYTFPDDITPQELEQVANQIAGQAGPPQTGQHVLTPEQRAGIEQRAAARGYKTGRAAGPVPPVDVKAGMGQNWNAFKAGAMGGLATMVTGVPGILYDAATNAVKAPIHTVKSIAKGVTNQTPGQGVIPAIQEQFQQDPYQWPTTGMDFAQKTGEATTQFAKEQFFPVDPALDTELATALGFATPEALETAISGGLPIAKSIIRKLAPRLKNRLITKYMGGGIGKFGQNAGEFYSDTKAGVAFNDYGVEKNITKRLEEVGTLKDRMLAGPHGQNRVIDGIDVVDQLLQKRPAAVTDSQFNEWQAFAQRLRDKVLAINPQGMLTPQEAENLIRNKEIGAIWSRMTPTLMDEAANQAVVNHAEQFFRQAAEHYVPNLKEANTMMASGVEAKNQIRQRIIENETRQPNTPSIIDVATGGLTAAVKHVGRGIGESIAHGRGFSYGTSPGITTTPGRTGLSTWLGTRPDWMSNPISNQPVPPPPIPSVVRNAPPPPAPPPIGPGPSSPWSPPPAGQGGPSRIFYGGPGGQAFALPPNMPLDDVLNNTGNELFPVTQLPVGTSLQDKVTSLSSPLTITHDVTPPPPAGPWADFGRLTPIVDDMPQRQIIESGQYQGGIDPMQMRSTPDPVAPAADAGSVPPDLAGKRPGVDINLPPPVKKGSKKKSSQAEVSPTVDSAKLKPLTPQAVLAGASTPDGDTDLLAGKPIASYAHAEPPFSVVQFGESFAAPVEDDFLLATDPDTARAVNANAPLSSYTTRVFGQTPDRMLSESRQVMADAERGNRPRFMEISPEDRHARYKEKEFRAETARIEADEAEENYARAFDEYQKNLAKFSAFQGEFADNPFKYDTSRAHQYRNYTQDQTKEAQHFVEETTRRQNMQNKLYQRTVNPNDISADITSGDGLNLPNIGASYDALYASWLDLERRYPYATTQIDELRRANLASGAAAQYDVRFPRTIFVNPKYLMENAVIKGKPEAVANDLIHELTHASQGTMGTLAPSAHPESKVPYYPDRTQSLFQNELNAYRRGNRHERNLRQRRLRGYSMFNNSFITPPPPRKK